MVGLRNSSPAGWKSMPKLRNPPTSASLPVSSTCLSPPSTTFTVPHTLTTNPEMFQTERRVEHCCLSVCLSVCLYTAGTAIQEHSPTSERASDDFPRRTRTHFTPQQLSCMEDKFFENQYPDLKTREEIAKSLKLQEMQVQVS